MRIATVWLVSLSLTVVCMAQGNKSRITPTPDPKAPFKVYVPRDLDDALVELKKMLSTGLVSEIREKSEREMSFYHEGIGRWLRNNWGLWAGSRLAQYFNEKGISHPDDMSGIILTSFWRHLHSRPIGLEEQIRTYQEYWRKVEEKEEEVSAVSERAMNRPLRSYNGDNLKLADYRGKKVVVLGWWFLLCKTSDSDCEVLAQLVKLKRDYGDKGVEVIGMPGIYPFNPEKETPVVKSLIRKYGVNFPLVWVDDTFTDDVVEYEKFGYTSTPQVFVISREGFVVKRIRGFDSKANPAVLREAVEKSLDGVPGGANRRWRKKDGTG